MEKLHSSFLDSLGSPVVVFLLQAGESIWAAVAYVRDQVWVILSFIGKFFYYLLQDFWRFQGRRTFRLVLGRQDRVWEVGEASLSAEATE